MNKGRTDSQRGFRVFFIQENPKASLYSLKIVGYYSQKFNRFIKCYLTGLVNFLSAELAGRCEINMAPAVVGIVCAAIYQRPILFGTLDC